MEIPENYPGSRVQIHGEDGSSLKIIELWTSHSYIENRIRLTLEDGTAVTVALDNAHSEQVASAIRRTLDRDWKAADEKSQKLLRSLIDSGQLDEDEYGQFLDD